MKNPPAAAGTTFAPFQKGQVWRIGDVNLAVTSVGKTLVEYTQYKAQPMGLSRTLCSKQNLQKYLISSEAVLTSQ